MGHHDALAETLAIEFHLDAIQSICQQAIWLEQAIFLGSRKDMDDIAAAFEKVYENRDELNRRFQRS